MTTATTPRTKRLTAEPLTAEAFAAFGSVVAPFGHDQPPAGAHASNGGTPGTWHHGLVAAAVEAGSFAVIERHVAADVAVDCDEVALAPGFGWIWRRLVQPMTSPDTQSHMHTHLRDYTPADRHACLTSFRSNVPAFFSAQDEDWFISALDEPDGPNFVVVCDGQVVGFGGYEVSSTYNHAVLVFGHIHAQWHGRGLGSRLLQHRIAHLKAHGPPTKYLIIDTTIQVTPFYVKHGFDIVAHWRAGFRDGVDKIDLRLVLC